MGIFGSTESILSPMNLALVAFWPIALISKISWMYSIHVWKILFFFGSLLYPNPTVDMLPHLKELCIFFHFEIIFQKRLSLYVIRRFGTKFDRGDYIIWNPPIFWRLFGIEKIHNNLVWNIRDDINKWKDSTEILHWSYDTYKYA